MQRITGDELKKFKKEDNFSTGFRDIDEYMGYVEKGSIITIGARPSMGKTNFALNILLHLAEKKKKVFYFSMDLPTERIIKRILCLKTEMPALKILQGDLKEKDWDKLSDAMAVLADYFIYINDKSALTVDALEEEIKNSEVKPDVVFIDYIQLLKMPKAPNYTDSINLAMQEIKRITKETGVIFVILTQLSRAVESRYDKRPMLSDIRSSNLLEELSDVVMMIYRDEYYNTDDETNKNLAEIIFCKNDFGPTMAINLRFVRELCSFRNIEPIRHNF
jgi:replicative DNA helicase